MNELYVKLQTFDAQIWAQEFMRLFEHDKNAIDESLMTTWFATALMIGYDCKREKEAIEDKNEP
jgi:hypothetical protein